MKCVKNSSVWIVKAHHIKYERLIENIFSRHTQFKSMKNESLSTETKLQKKNSIVRQRGRNWIEII